MNKFQLLPLTLAVSAALQPLLLQLLASLRLSWQVIQWSVIAKVQKLKPMLLPYEKRRKHGYRFA